MCRAARYKYRLSRESLHWSSATEIRVASVSDRSGVDQEDFRYVRTSVRRRKGWHQAALGTPCVGHCEVVC